MLKILGIEKGSPAARSGLRAGDRVVSINGETVSDGLDLMFHASNPVLRMVISRTGGTVRRTVKNPSLGGAGVVPEEFKIRKCGNRCIFCFVDQMPKGLRGTLYVKDEDFRLSFLHGAYICANNLTQKDRRRIYAQKLSPLYISVHATGPALRRRLLGNRRVPPVMGLLREFAEHGIKFHTQVVVCPGVNDGRALGRTIDDLTALYPVLLSIAVIPVGLTRHRKGLPKLRPVTKRHARVLIKAMRRKQKALMKKHGRNFLFLADELYIKAGASLPAYDHYRDFPQYENGVGMMRDFIEHFRDRLKGIKPRTGVLTGVSAARFVRQCVRRLKGGHVVIPVKNRLFGGSVTVTGLLCGRDIVKAALPRRNRVDRFMLPPNCLNHDGLTLDGMTVRDLSRALGSPVIVPRRR